MKKILLLVCILLCMGISAYAAEYTYDHTYMSPILIDEPGEHTVILNGVKLEWYDDIQGMFDYYGMSIRQAETKVIIILKDGTTNVMGYILSDKGDSDIVIRCENAGENHKCTDACGKLIIHGVGRHAGIGSKKGYPFSGSIAIMGGNLVFEESSRGANIGSGEDGDFTGSITISGGNLTFKDASRGAGIGSGENGVMSGTITIANSTVTMEKGSWGAGIGSGEDGKMSGTITITDSTVAMEWGSWGAGIGSGYGGNYSGTVAIIDSTVDVAGISGIGAGEGGDFTGKLIMRGDVDVTARGDYWGIGPGHDGPFGEGAEVYVEPVNNVIGVKQGEDEYEAVNLAGTPYSVKTDLIPLLDGSRYVRTRYNTKTVTPIPATPTPAPEIPGTGDETNFVLLAALAVVGMIGMTVIIRKKNEA